MRTRTLITNATCIFVGISAVYWATLAISVYFGWWPVVSMTYDLFTMEPVYAFDAIAHAVFAVVAFFAAADL